MEDTFYNSALDYHKFPKPGKLEIQATKPLENQRDLALAYSPGVAAACKEIEKDPNTAALYTARANMVAVISNGTAVLGLGNIGPLASKPVMEGKAVLFKKFADIDVFDIEIDEKDPEKLIDIIASLEPTFGGINLEDIKAPECFMIEQRLKERMKIPVFHDDQHGTAIIVAAAVLNGLRLVGKKIENVKLVTSGAGAAALACLDLLVSMGMRKENIFISDMDGIVYDGREKVDPTKKVYSQKTKYRTVADALDKADIFLGLSVAGVIKPDMLAPMAKNPLILALANPVPEILPEDAKSARPDAIVATGRSDYPNQVNNVLCFPFIFRGALDVGATTINQEMKIACVKAIADLAMAEASDVVAAAYDTEDLQFGANYIIPKPFDPRLIVSIPPAVAKAAMDSGVATRPIEDFDAYTHKLSEFVFRSGMVMRPLFQKAKADLKRIVFSDGEDERVLRAVQMIVDEKIAKPIIIGRRDVVEKRITQLALRLKEGEHFDLTDPQNDSRYHQYHTHYHQLMQRKGVSPSQAKSLVRTNTTVIAALMVSIGDADGMICGLVGSYDQHLKDALNIIGLRPGVSTPASMSALVLNSGPYFFTDTYVNYDPSAQQIAEITVMASEQIKRFGIAPKVALLSQSNFGSVPVPSSVKMQQALSILMNAAPDLEVDGEMHADAALSETIRHITMPQSRLNGAANLLVMPNRDASHIAFSMLKILGDGLPIGPILLGSAKPVHILTPSVTVRGLFNMTALACIDAQELNSQKNQVAQKTSGSLLSKILSKTQ